MITAPFNFVPLSEKVFFPDWADDVSHDVPFEDFQSGSIDISITAKSPIFIRNNYVEGDAYVEEDKKRVSTEFCHYNGTPYIPSSSVKGMIRNVLEILSFSKMSEDSYNDDTYAVRDLSSSNNFYMTEMKKKTYSGWLKKIGDKYIIEDCGIAGRIRHEEIDKAFSVNFSKYFKSKNFKGRDTKQKTSEYKYNLLNQNDLTLRVGKKFFSKTNTYDTREFYTYDSNGQNSGTLVLTGQPTARKDSGQKGDGKGYEFIFFKSQGTLSVDERVIKKLLFAYFDKRTTEPKESSDWTYWKTKLEDNKKIPVFFQKDDMGNIKHIGLSYLYKLPYTHSVSGGIPKSHNDKRVDLAETMFGNIDDDNALKGRIQFSHFKANDTLEELSLEPRGVVLGTPRASYYPIYVKQVENNLFTTFMDDEFSISGRKRYPINTKIEVYPLVRNKDGKVNTKIVTTLKPIKENVVFQGKVRFHNLNKVELGALLSALTFHNTKGCFHNIGMAKPLGYGKIKVNVTGIDIDKYLKYFEKTMSETVFEWSNQEQLTELVTMASEQDNDENSKLCYMDLANFASEKTNEYYLDNYTALDNIETIRVKSLLSKDELKIIEVIQKEKELEEELRQEKIEEEIKLQEEKRVKLEVEQKELEELRKEFQKKLDNVLNTDNPKILENFIAKHPNHEKIDEIKAKKEQIELENKKNRFKEIDVKFKKVYEELRDKKGNKSKYKKELDKFIKKWEKGQNHKGSLLVLESIEKLKKER